MGSGVEVGTWLVRCKKSCPQNVIMIYEIDRGSWMIFLKKHQLVGGV